MLARQHHLLFCPLNSLGHHTKWVSVVLASSGQKESLKKMELMFSNAGSLNHRADTGGVGAGLQSRRTAGLWHTAGAPSSSCGHSAGSTVEKEKVKDSHVQTQTRSLRTPGMSVGPISVFPMLTSSDAFIFAVSSLIPHRINICTQLPTCVTIAYIYLYEREYLCFTSDLECFC